MSAALQSSAIKMFHTILFDLDGTLTDPGEGITNSVAYALKHYGITVEDRKKLYPFIGPPLPESFMRYFGMSEETALEAVEIYREYFSTKGLLENRPYDGIEDLLKKLKDAGKRLIVATSKPEEFSVRILEHFGLAKYFDLICGALMHPPKGYGKADVIQDALTRCNITDLDSTIMVGDRLHDVEGAHKIGLPAIGVLYGYGDRQELETAGADYIAENISTLSELLLNIN